MSLITSIIGGVQGASAQTDAANARVAGANQAADTVDKATAAVNPQIAAAAEAAGIGVTNAAGTAGAGVINKANDAGRDVTGAAVDANTRLDPYTSAGANAAGKLNDFVNADKQFTFNQDDPSYQWRVQEGQKAIERSASARGAAQGGGVLQALTQYGQQMGSTEYGAAFDRFNKTQDRRFAQLSGVAGMGLTASDEAGKNTIGAARYAGDIGTHAAEYAGNLNADAAARTAGFGMHAADEEAGNTLTAANFRGSTQIAAADARAQEHIGRANAWNGMLSGIGGAVDSAVAGGFSGGKGFKLGDMVKGSYGYGRPPMPGYGGYGGYGSGGYGGYRRAPEAAPYDFGPPAPRY